MKKNNIEEIEATEEKTGAKSVSSFLSGLSVMDKFKEVERDSNIYFAKAKYNLKNFISALQESLSPKSIAAYSLVAVMALSLAGCDNKENNNDNMSATTITIGNEDVIKDLIPRKSLFKLTLNKSESESQRKVYSSVGKFLADYNIRFAKPYAENVLGTNSITGNTELTRVKPALTWNEVMAMTFIYNDFSKDELLEILNGAEINAQDLKNSYRTAIFQLAGAHVIETSNHPVRIDTLLQDEKAQEFYQKYHTMFLRCKETSGEERLVAVKKFYIELYKDFPITAEIRQEGLMHSDARKLVEPYKFSIIPMVAASEMLFQNLEVNHTMPQQLIDFMNDLGACNIADDILDKVVMLGLTSETNQGYADYGKLRGALIEFLVSEDAYNIRDEERDISKLSLFQEIILKYLGLPESYTVTYTITNNYTVTTEIHTKDRDEAVAAAGEDAVAAAEKAAQEALERENQGNKAQAEQEADKWAEQMQQEEDRKREELQQQVDSSAQDYQTQINEANNNSGIINEDDLGHGTDFDYNHSDGNGNLDTSVSDITTESAGDMTNEPLPDPNADYNYSREAETFTDGYLSTGDSIGDASGSINGNEESIYSNNEPIYSYEEPYYASEEDIDAYVESLAYAFTVEDSPKILILSWHM